MLSKITIKNIFDCMQINEPVVAIRFFGDVKKNIIGNKYVAVASYEVIENYTIVIITVSFCPENLKIAFLKEVEKYWKKYGKILSINYYPDGADIHQMQTLN